MKNIEDINIIIQARLNSQRIPRKMIKPFADTTLFDCILEKLDYKCIIPKEQIYLSIHEEELKDIANRYSFNIFERSEKSANSEGTPLTEIYEWWDKLPGKYVVLINACCPFLTRQTINDFIEKYQTCGTNGAFGVIEKKNYFWKQNGEALISLTEDVMNTKTAPVTLEAAHVLYAGKMEDIGKGIWMGNLATGDGMTFISLPERECLDIDYPWQFEMWAAVYHALYTNYHE